MCPWGALPFSLWDWRAWAQARPTLWLYGDATNLGPARPTPLLTHEWISCLLLREEMEYTMDSDPGPYRAHDDPTAPRVNRFAADWITLHLFATIFWLAHVSVTPCVQLHHVHHRPHQILAGYSGSTFALPPAPH